MLKSGLPFYISDDVEMCLGYVSLYGALQDEWLSREKKPMKECVRFLVISIHDIIRCITFGDDRLRGL